MSLWYKTIDAITFDDVDVFCQQRHREGVRLDYKQEVPSELANIVAAMANTLGGLILIGVQADPKTNEPVWPPTAGQPAKTGLEEQVTAICRDNIYPPVRPHISAVLENRHLPGHVVLVLRIDESPQAPHAINNRRRIYERTGSQNRPNDLADVDRIEQLLRRRGQIVEQRLELIRDELHRATRQVAEASLALGQAAGLQPAIHQEPALRSLPLRWVSVIPYYPWRDLCSPETCLRLLPQWPQADEVQRVPRGAFARSRYQVNGISHVIGTAGLSARGHLLASGCAVEVYEGAMLAKQFNRPQKDHWLDFERTRSFLQGAFSFAADFLRQPGTEMPGTVLVSLGLVGVLGLRMHHHSSGAQGRAFVDEQFGADYTVTAEEFLADPRAAAGPLLKDLAFGFDLPSPQ